MITSAALRQFVYDDRATPEIYTLSLHDALPICRGRRPAGGVPGHRIQGEGSPRPLASVQASQCHRGQYRRRAVGGLDRKSTRLNSSHRCISYAVLCLKKKKQILSGCAVTPVLTT